MQVEIVERSEFTSHPSSLGGERIRLKNILVPTDFSETSVKAVSYGVALARQFGATLWLLHVLLPTPSYTGMETIPIAMDAIVTAEAERQMAEFTVQHVPTDVAVTTLVRHGAAEKEISEFAAEREIDLVVASTHEHSRLERALFGGLTERIVHHAPCPILIVREHEHEFLDASTIRIKRILAPADFSECATKALRYALAFAGQYGAEVTCLHVMEPEKPKIIFETEGFYKTQRVEAERKFETLVDELDAGKVKRAFITGVPHKSIVETADKEGSDLIILGEHSKSGVFGRFMLGSTTDEVVKHAHCPILVVRPNEHEFVG